jgi:ribosomal RNA-processing protein 36
MKKRFDSSDSEADNGEPEMVGSRPDRADEEPSTSGRGSNSDSDSDLDEQEQALEQQLADIPFEILEKLNQDGKGPSPAAARAAAIAAKQKVFHRENKNRPQEMSSKRPVSRFKEVIQVPKR